MHHHLSFNHIIYCSCTVRLRYCIIKNLADCWLLLASTPNQFVFTLQHSCLFCGGVPEPNSQRLWLQKSSPNLLQTPWFMPTEFGVQSCCCASSLGAVASVEVASVEADLKCKIQRLEPSQLTTHNTQVLRGYWALRTLEPWTFQMLSQEPVVQNGSTMAILQSLVVSLVGNSFDFASRTSTPTNITKLESNQWNLPRRHLWWEVDANRQISQSQGLYLHTLISHI